MLHIPLGDDGRRSGIVGAVADDWRVTVTFRDEADVQQAVQSVREHEVEDDVRSRLGHRVAMSVDGPTVFLYAGTEDTARETDRVVREVSERRGEHVHPYCCLNDLRADYALEVKRVLESGGGGDTEVSGSRNR